MKPRLFHLIAQARQNLFRSADKVFLDALGVSGTQVVALFAIEREPGCLLKDLASQLQLKNSAITSLVVRMEENGLIVKQPCSIDGRASRLNVSGKGKAVLAKAYPLLNAINVQLKNGFSEAEIGIVARFLNHAIAVDFNKEIAK